MSCRTARILLGFGLSSGMGAGAGLVTAIVAGALAAVFGGSRVQVSGPTGAMTVVLVPIIATYGRDGVLVVGLLAGLILIGLGYVGAGRFIRYVPIPVVEGFTVGIAVIIALQQIPAVLGVRVHTDNVLVLALRAVESWAADPVWAPLAVTIGVALAVLVLARVAPRFPGSLVAVAVATAANATLDWGARRSATSLPGSRRPRCPPSSSPTSTLCSCRRTAVNVRSGAASRLAALTRSLVLLLVALVATRWVAEIPLAVNRPGRCPDRHCGRDRRR
jgi:SulP family sulfate permease